MQSGQRVDSVRVEEDFAALEGRSLSIRFPVSWARKLVLWSHGSGRNIICNADPRRFNLVGVTKTPTGFVFTYVDSEGNLRAESGSMSLLAVLGDLLGD